MKKFRLLILTLVVLLMASFTFTACGKDDGGDKGSSTTSTTSFMSDEETTLSNGTVSITSNGGAGENTSTNAGANTSAQASARPNASAGNSNTSFVQGENFISVEEVLELKEDVVDYVILTNKHALPEGANLTTIRQNLLVEFEEMVSAFSDEQVTALLEQITANVFYSKEEATAVIEALTEVARIKQSSVSTMTEILNRYDGVVSTEEEWHALIDLVFAITPYNQFSWSGDAFDHTISDWNYSSDEWDGGLLTGLENAYYRDGSILLSTNTTLFDALLATQTAFAGANQNGTEIEQQKYEDYQTICTILKSIDQKCASVKDNVGDVWGYSTMLINAVTTEEIIAMFGNEELETILYEEIGIGDAQIKAAYEEVLITIAKASMGRYIEIINSFDFAELEAISAFANMMTNGVSVEPDMEKLIGAVNKLGAKIKASFMTDTEKQDFVSACKTLNEDGIGYLAEKYIDLYRYAIDFVGEVLSEMTLDDFSNIMGGQNPIIGLISFALPTYNQYEYKNELRASFGDNASFDTIIAQAEILADFDPATDDPSIMATAMQTIQNTAMLWVNANYEYVMTLQESIAGYVQPFMMLREVIMSSVPQQGTVTGSSSFVDYSDFSKVSTSLMSI